MTLLNPLPPAREERRRVLSRWRGLGVWAAAAAMIAAAGVVNLLVPDEIHEDDAFRAPVSADGWAANRTIRVHIDEVVRADAVHQEDLGSVWHGEANWIVVQLRGEALSDGMRGRIGDARLTVDGVTYRSTESVGADARAGSYMVGIPAVTSLAFELPPGVDPTSATLRIWPNETYPTLDTEIIFELDLTGARHVDDVELLSAKLVTQ